MLLPRPRAYVDWNVPLDDHGVEIGVCHDPETYARYLDWLTDYLYRTNIPVPRNQATLLENYRKAGVDRAVLDLSGELGCSIWQTEIIEQAIAEGQSFTEVHKFLEKTFKELPDEERAMWLRADYFISREDFERIKCEWDESRRVPSHIQHADIAYRAILAALFKGIQEKDRRREFLRSFYGNFNECASK